MTFVRISSLVNLFSSQTASVNASGTYDYSPALKFVTTLGSRYSDVGFTRTDATGATANAPPVGPTPAPPSAPVAAAPAADAAAADAAPAAVTADAAG